MIDFNKARLSATITAADFVMPALNDAGNVKTGQRIKTGMMVECLVKQANWGNVKYERTFVGVVLDVVSAETVIVRPLMGRRGNVAVLRVGEYSYYRYDASNTVPKEYLRMACTRRSLTILNPQTVGTSHYEVMDKFAALFTGQHLRNYKENLYKKLAAAEQARRLVQGRTGRKDDYAEYVAANNPAIRVAKYWKPATELGKQVGRGMVRIREALAGKRLLRDVKFATMEARQSMYKVWNKVHIRQPELMLAKANSCGHMSLNAALRQVHDRYGDRTQVCGDCFAEKLATGEYMELLDAQGRTNLWQNGCTVYEWDDGTKRSAPPPPVIGAYHSSKKFVGALPKMDGQPFNGLTIGLELEVEISPRASESHDRYGNENLREKIARGLMQRVKAARPAAWNGDVKAPGYAFCENDGSVSNGFEMVTSYGSIDVHRQMILSIFGPDRDSDVHPFDGKLRSNDAEQSCGLHVHLAKPETLSHAAKMQAFYHDPANRKLVRAVARRYAVHYAKAMNGKTKDTVAVNTKNALGGYGRQLNSRNRGHWDDSKKDIISRAITRLSDGDRYQQVNYCNEHTVEIRVFKGSMLPTTIIACIEFSHAVWMFSRDAVAADLTTPKFMDFINRPDNRCETKYLRGYLAQRGFTVFQPRVHKDTKEFATEINAEEA